MSRQPSSRSSSSSASRTGGAEQSEMFEKNSGALGLRPAEAELMTGAEHCTERLEGTSDPDEMETEVLRSRLCRLLRSSREFGGKLEH